MSTSTFDPAVIFATMAEGVYVRAADKTLVWINPAAAAICGWRPEEAVGRKCYELFGDDSHSCRTVCPLDRALNSGMPLTRFERRFTCRDGSCQEVLVTLMPHDPAEKSGRVVALIQDIADNKRTLAAYQREIEERKQAEQALARHNELLSVINHLQTDFFLEEDAGAFFRKLVDTFLALTHSRFGFIAEISYSPEEHLFLHCLAISGLGGDANALAFYRERYLPGLKLGCGNNLIGAVVRTGEVVIANDPQHDPRRGSLPPGHPPLSAFLGIPLFAGKNLVGIIGLANRPDGYDQALVSAIQPAVSAAANLMKAYCAERDRGQREAVINERDRLIATMADTIEDVFWIADWQSRATIFVSKSFETIWGQPRHDLYQTPLAWTAAIHSDDRERVTAAFDGMERSGYFDEQYRIVRPDGEVRWIRDHGYPLREQGRVVQVAGIAQDITRWRRAEEDNAKHRQRLEFILGATKTGLSVLGADFILRYVDPASVLRYGPYEGRYCYEYFRQQTAPCPDCGMVRSRESGQPHVTESVLPLEDQRPVQVTTIPFVDENGEQLFAEVKVDIMERKRAEETLRHNERLYRGLVESTSAITWELDIASQRFTYVAPQVTAILGYPPEQWTDFNFWVGRIVDEDRQVTVNDCLMAAARGLDHQFEYRMRTADGRVIWVRELVTVISEGGKPCTLRGFFFDISAAKEAEIALSRHANTQSLQNRLLGLSFRNLSLGELLDQCLAVITSIPWLHVRPQGAIFLRDPGQDRLLLKAQLGFPDEQVTACSSVAFGSCLCGLAAESGRVVWANHIDDRHTITFPGIAPHGHFCVPFFSSRQELLGVFTVYTAVARERDDQVEKTLTLLAKVLALIIERNQFEQEIIEARDEWARTFDAVGDLLMIIDDQYRVLKVNKALADRLQVTPEQYLNRFCYQLIHGSEKPIKGCPHRQTLHDGRPHTAEIREDSLDSDFVVSVAPITSEEGRDRKFIHVIHDVTERKRREQQLKQFADTQAVLLKEVNHRVKNNLTAIISMLHKEEDRANQENRPEFAARLTKIETRIEGLLTVHTLLSNCQWQPLLVSDLCREVAERTVACTAKSQHLDVAVSPSTLTIGSDQAHYLALVVNELTTNTIKYGGQHGRGGRIEMTIAEDDGRVVLTYRDDGPGFPDALLQGDRLVSGIGFDLIDGIVKKSLHGEISFANDRGGVARIAFVLTSTGQGRKS